jgi:hypothetical protein
MLEPGAAVARKYLMRIHELLAGHPLLEINSDDPGLGTYTSLATIAAPGVAPVVDPEITLTGLKPLRRLKRLDHGTLQLDKEPS